MARAPDSRTAASAAGSGSAAGTRSGTDRAGGRRVGGEQLVDLGVGGVEQPGDDAGHDEVAVGGEGTSLVDGQHSVDGTTAAPPIAAAVTT